MKKLTELFSELDDIDELIISECNIDLFWNTPYFEYNDNLYESLGIFNGCKEITKYLFSQLQKNIGETELAIDITGLKCENKFFNSCFFHITNNIKQTNIISFGKNLLIIYIK